MTSHLSLARLAFSIFCCFLILTVFVGLSQAAGNLNIQLNAYHNTQRQKLAGKAAPVQFRFALTLHGQARGSTGSAGRQQLLSYTQSTGTSYTDTTGLVTFASPAGDAAFQKPFSLQLDDKIERTADLQVTVTAAAATATVFSVKLVASATTNSASTPIKLVTQKVTSPDGNHILDFSYWFICLHGSYGPECDRTCVAQDSDLTGHYLCAHDTGDKVCLTGWSDPTKDCKVRVGSTPSPLKPPSIDTTPQQNPTSATSTQEDDSKKSSGGLNPGVVITIVVALIFALVAIVGGVMLFNLNLTDVSDAEAPDSEQNRKKAGQKQRKR